MPRSCRHAAATVSPPDSPGRPPGATVTVTVTDSQVRAVVTLHATPLGLSLGTFEVAAVSVAAREPGVVR